MNLTVEFTVLIWLQASPVKVRQAKIHLAMNELHDLSIFSVLFSSHRILIYIYANLEGSIELEFVGFGGGPNKSEEKKSIKLQLATNLRKSSQGKK